jgi:hypothetical protein
MLPAPVFIGREEKHGRPAAGARLRTTAVTASTAAAGEWRDLGMITGLQGIRPAGSLSALTTSLLRPANGIVAEARIRVCDGSLGATF